VIARPRADRQVLELARRGAPPPGHQLVVDSGFVPNPSGPIGDVHPSAQHLPQATTHVPDGIGPIDMAPLAERLTIQQAAPDLASWCYHSPMRTVEARRPSKTCLPGKDRLPLRTPGRPLPGSGQGPKMVPMGRTEPDKGIIGSGMWPRRRVPEHHSAP
jgi:hypothetical protein